MNEIKKLKKYYMKIFDRNNILWKEFLKLYNEAVAEGSEIPAEVAMIRFREKYIETDMGWEEK